MFEVYLKLFRNLKRRGWARGMARREMAKRGMIVHLSGGKCVLEDYLTMASGLVAVFERRQSPNPA